MATFVSGTAWGTWSGMTRYAYLTGDVSRNGNIVTLSNLSLYFTLPGSGWGSASETVYIRNNDASGTSLSTTGVSWRFSGGSTSNTVSLNNASVSVAVNDTSHTFCLFCDPSDTAIFTVSFSSAVVAPTAPTISGVQNDRQSNIITYGTSSFGNPSSGTVYLYGGTTSTPTTLIASKTSTGSSQRTHSGLESNTTYYYRARAYNGYAYSSYSPVISVKTKPAVYVSSGGVSKATQKLYASLNGQSKTVLKLYDSHNGVSRRIY